VTATLAFVACSLESYSAKAANQEHDKKQQARQEKTRSAAAIWRRAAYVWFQNPCSAVGLGRTPGRCCLTGPTVSGVALKMAPEPESLRAKPKKAPHFVCRRSGQTSPPGATPTWFKIQGYIRDEQPWTRLCCSNLHL
jgi:hypothetical protein